MEAEAAKPKLTAADIELAIAEWFGPRRCLIVPNVSWGMGMHECDVLALSRSGYASEVEIKVSKSDLKRDGRKRHGHRDRRIKCLYFAMPESMRDCIGLVPEHAGVVLIHQHEGDHTYHWCELIREAVPTELASKWTDAERLHLASLGSLRIWNLKKRIRDLERRVHAHAEEARSGQG